MQIWNAEEKSANRLSNPVISPMELFILGKCHLWGFIVWWGCNSLTAPKFVPGNFWVGILFRDDNWRTALWSQEKTDRLIESKVHRRNMLYRYFDELCGVWILRTGLGDWLGINAPFDLSTDEERSNPSFRGWLAYWFCRGLVLAASWRESLADQLIQIAASGRQ